MEDKKKKKKNDGGLLGIAKRALGGRKARLDAAMALATGKRDAKAKKTK